MDMDIIKCGMKFLPDARISRGYSPPSWYMWITSDYGKSTTNLWAVTIVKTFQGAFENFIILKMLNFGSFPLAHVCGYENI